MKVKFIYPYHFFEKKGNSFSSDYVEANANKGDVVDLMYLTNTQAIFENGIEMPLAVFFKITEPVKESVNGIKNNYPSNFNDQFERLWAAKGKKGSKAKAKDKYKRMFANESNETCESLTDILINDIESNMGELGMLEMHLTTYLNQERWERD